MDLHHSYQEEVAEEGEEGEEEAVRRRRGR